MTLSSAAAHPRRRGYPKRSPPLLPNGYRGGRPLKQQSAPRFGALFTLVETVVAVQASPLNQPNQRGPQDCGQAIHLSRRSGGTPDSLSIWRNLIAIPISSANSIFITFLVIHYAPLSLLPLWNTESLLHSRRSKEEPIKCDKTGWRQAVYLRDTRDTALTRTAFGLHLARLRCADAHQLKGWKVEGVITTIRTYLGHRT